YGLEENGGIAPRACMCSLDSGFLIGKTPSDNCAYCGFQCESDTYMIGNYDRARTTFRRS
ncbi:MAG: putative bacteriocin precursor, partial [Eubacterium sp.]